MTLQPCASWAAPVDAQGVPTGAAQDIRELGYAVQFFFDGPPDVLDPTALPDGTAFAVLNGQNIIRADYTSVRVIDEEPVLAFWPATVAGFDIARFTAIGQPPRLRALGGTMPVVVPSQAVIRLRAFLSSRIALIRTSIRIVTPRCTRIRVGAVQGYCT